MAENRLTNAIDTTSYSQGFPPQSASKDTWYWSSSIPKSLRYRLTFRGMKGSISFEATVDGEGFTMDEVLAESDKLVEALEQRYPAKVE